MSYDTNMYGIKAPIDPSLAPATKNEKPALRSFNTGRDKFGSGLEIRIVDVARSAAESSPILFDLSSIESIFWFDDPDIIVVWWDSLGK
jgi:hypothetical protein